MRIIGLAVACFAVITATIALRQSEFPVDSTALQTSSNTNVSGELGRAELVAHELELMNAQRVSTLAETTIPAVRGPRVSDRFPNISLVNHRGENIQFYDDLVKDRSVCIVFFYTRCVGSCPGTTVALKHLRRELASEFDNENLKLISLTLEPDIDSPEELREYMDRYGIDDDPSLPDWVYATGDFEELDTLRRSLGVYDLDPIIDADKTEHAAILTFGNDRTDRWAALPVGMNRSDMIKAMVRILGNNSRQSYREVAKISERLSLSPDDPSSDAYRLGATSSCCKESE